MQTNHAILAAILLSSSPAFAGSASPTVAQPITPAAAPSEWSVRLSLYGWLETLNGDTGVRGYTLPVDVKFNDLLSNLDFTFMGAVEIDHGRWGFVADGIYASLSDSGNGPHGFVSADMNLEQFTWQAMTGFGYHFNEHSSLLLGYRAIGTDYTHSGFTYDITTQGIILGYQYTF